MTEAIVTARGLTKSFGRKEVLRGIDFTIPAGRIYGLLGENGAGKTTAVNALLGLTDCGGQLNVLGLEPFRNRARLMNEVAFISDVASLPRFLKVGQLLELVSDIHPKFDRVKAERLLGETHLTPDLKIKTLSKGMIAQLHLALVISIDARLLVLDEPTLGLDITYRKRFYRQLLDDYMTGERTVLITTHQVDEIESLLTDIMFLHDGEIVLDSPMEDIGSQFVQLTVADAQSAEAEKLAPIYTESRLGQAMMIFRGVQPDRLAPLGQITTPSLSDLFVTLMQCQDAVSGEA